MRGRAKNGLLKPRTGRFRVLRCRTPATDDWPIRRNPIGARVLATRRTRQIGPTQDTSPAAQRQPESCAKDEPAVERLTGDEAAGFHAGIDDERRRREGAPESNRRALDPAPNHAAPLERSAHLVDAEVRHHAERERRLFPELAPHFEAPSRDSPSVDRGPD